MLARTGSNVADPSDLHILLARLAARRPRRRRHRERNRV